MVELVRCYLRPPVLFEAFGAGASAMPSYLMHRVGQG